MLNYVLKTPVVQENAKTSYEKGFKNKVYCATAKSPCPWEI